MNVDALKDVKGRGRGDKIIRFLILFTQLPIKRVDWCGGKWVKESGVRKQRGEESNGEIQKREEDLSAGPRGE